MTFTGCGARENSLTALKRRSFSDCAGGSLRQVQSGTLQHDHQFSRTRVWGFMGIDGSGKTAYKRVYGRFTVYVRTGRLAGLISALVAGTYVRSD